VAEWQRLKMFLQLYFFSLCIPDYSICAELDVRSDPSHI
jgi:hypothetical protein